jgi:predicted phosphodiesterase
MVVLFRFRRAAWALPALLFFACNMPSYYNDYDSRFDWRNEFVFLEPAARSPALGNNYSFIVISDTHIANLQGAQQFAKIENILEPADKFIVITGDITDQGTREELQFFVNAASSLSVPCYPVMGNHDIYAERGKPWREIIGSSLYRIDAPGTTLFFLDNANAALGNEQLLWLEEGLKTVEQNVFVFAHDNLFVRSAPPNFEQITDIRERARIMSMLKNRCAAVFTGHLHQRIIREAGGVSYITLENYSEDRGSFCRVYVSNGGVRWEFGRVHF